MEKQKNIVEALTMLINGFEKITKSTKILTTGGRSHVALTIYPKKGESKKFCFTPEDYETLVSTYDRLKPNGPAI